MAAAYVIIDVDVLKPEVYEEYKKRGAPTILAHNGTPLVRGGRTLVLEGDWHPKRMIVLRFESTEAALAWWNSPEYTEAKKLRHQSARGNVVIVEGL